MTSKSIRGLLLAALSGGVISCQSDIEFFGFNREDSRTAQHSTESRDGLAEKEDNSVDLEIDGDEIEICLAADGDQCPDLEATISQESDPKDPTSEQVLTKDPDQPVVAFGLWTLRFPEVRSAKHIGTGCSGNATYRYRPPTLAQLKEYRTKLQAEFKRLNVAHVKVWSGDVAGGVDYYGLDLSNGSEFKGASVFGPSNTILCVCSEPNPEDFCGSSEPLGQPLFPKAGS